MYDGRVYLCAPVNALVEGIYEEKIPLADVKEHGDFGLGTFDHVDGEMVMLDGKIFQITADGKVHEVEENALTPFACVTFFESMCYDTAEREMSYSDFLAWLQNLLPSPNIIYAICIRGTFNYIRTRSVEKTENYHPLVEVAEHQHVFEFYDISGTLAGFFTPPFMSPLSVPGLHLHFLSDDCQHGGHLLECTTQAIRADVQFIYSLELSLPKSHDYLDMKFTRDIAEDLNKAEK